MREGGGRHERRSAWETVVQSLRRQRLIPESQSREGTALGERSATELSRIQLSKEANSLILVSHHEFTMNCNN